MQKKPLSLKTRPRMAAAPRKMSNVDKCTSLRGECTVFLTSLYVWDEWYQLDMQNLFPSVSSPFPIYLMSHISANNVRNRPKPSTTRQCLTLSYMQMLEKVLDP